MINQSTLVISKNQARLNNDSNKLENVNLDHKIKNYGKKKIIYFPFFTKLETRREDQNNPKFVENEDMQHSYEASSVRTT